VAKNRLFPGILANGHKQFAAAKWKAAMAKKKKKVAKPDFFQKLPKNLSGVLLSKIVVSEARSQEGKETGKARGFIMARGGQVRQGRESIDGRVFSGGPFGVADKESVT